MSEIRKVIEGGYCIGCGACSVVSSGSIRVQLGESGMYEAQLTAGFESRDSGLIAAVDYVCPFTGKGPNETEIAESLFPDPAVDHPKAGRYSHAYAGWVVEGEFRMRGSSGGLVSWFLCELMRLGRIDGVIHVKPRRGGQSGKPLFAFDISRDRSEIQMGAKSRYYPVSYADIFSFVEEHPGRYAVTGLPCFAKSIRLLAAVNDTIKDRIAVTAGLVCGHLKSAFYLDMMAWQLGISPDRAMSFDFRKKIECHDAHNYGVEASGETLAGLVRRQAFARDLYGTDWGKGFLKYHACDFCDDVLAETADVVFGDAWIPKYDRDWRGTNILVIRRPELNSIFAKASAEARIQLEDLSLDALLVSQAASFRHRRQGLAIRLAKKRKTGTWAPPKRVTPIGSAKGSAEYQTHVMRMEMSSSSHTAFQEAIRKDDFELFEKRMQGYEKRYQRVLMLRSLFRGNPRPCASYVKAVLMSIARVCIRKVGLGGTVTT